jgi:dihydroflavonol-4-reductase
MVTADRVLITGATGFVGSAVARAASARGFRVRVLVRPESKRANLVGFPNEIAEGDMKDEASVLRALEGVRYLFHVAADYRIWARDPGEIIRNNREGTRAVMAAAKASGVEKIVYTSSVATLRPVKDGAAGEASRLDENTAIGAYKMSKVVAEHLVERMIAEDSLPAVIVNPSTPIGSHDIKPTPTGRIIVEAATGRMPAFVDTGLNLVHVDDVAEGHMLALEKGRIGERYILGGQDATLEEMLGVIAPLVGRRPPRLRVPRALLYPLAYLAEAAARVSGKEPFITVDGLKMSKHKMFFSSAKAERELGYRARPYGLAIADAIAWFRAEGYLR